MNGHFYILSNSCVLQAFVDVGISFCVSGSSVPNMAAHQFAHMWSLIAITFDVASC